MEKEEEEEEVVEEKRDGIAYSVRDRGFEGRDERESDEKAQRRRRRGEREGRGREGKGREGRGREGKGKGSGRERGLAKKSWLKLDLGSQRREGWCGCYLTSPLVLAKRGEGGWKGGKEGEPAHQTRFADPQPPSLRVSVAVLRMMEDLPKTERKPSQPRCDHQVEDFKGKGTGGGSDSTRSAGCERRRC
ncbi:hypothetical protein IE53DRAFT_386170 [Violaceomyces palustris]|uniref:Uncharacterized protein n=1 Tax=Violaceomyces palustris TaxID=1673888 RepID=A0ACD0P0B6_9BASI|nr:hypothetical protein IE53DRAFT_386170 [Violaceomyces palustris]